MKIICLDLETSGLNPGENGIASIGACLLGHEYEGFYTECHIDDSQKISSRALEVNGFTKQELRDKDKHSTKDILELLNQWVQSAVPLAGGIILAGQNIASFDIQFLRHEYKKAHPLPYLFGYHSMDLHAVALMITGKSLTMDGVGELLGIGEEEKPHNALRGAQFTSRCIMGLMNEFMVKPRWRS